MNVLLPYVFPVSVVVPTPPASTAFLKQVCLVCKPKTGQEGNVGQIFECTTMTQVAARTDNTNAEELFDAGMTKVFVLLSATLNLETALQDVTDFYTVLVSSDFTDSDIATGIITPAVKAEKKIQDILFKARTAGTAGNGITINYNTGGTAGAETVGVVGSAITVTMEDGESTAQNIADAIEAEGAADALVECIIDSGDEADVQAVFGAAENLAGGAAAITGVGLDVGDFDGVTGISTDDTAVAEAQAIIGKRSAFKAKTELKGKNMAFAFGKLLSNLVNWLNQQFIEMPENDEIESLGDAISLFDERVSFVLTDEQYGNRLAFFAAGGKAIIAPYILKNFEIDLQSRTLQWISQNQPQYTVQAAALLESRLREDVLQLYIDRGWLTGGTVEIKLENQNFTASGYLEVPEPTALWRVNTQLTQTV